MKISVSTLLTAAAACLALNSVAVSQEKVNYTDHVLPIFRSKCFSCHNTNKKTADLDLSNYTAMMQGGASGEVIVPGDAAASYLYMVMAHETEPYMPPKSDRVADAMLGTVKSWIDAGAPETSSSKVMLPKKTNVNMSVDVAAGARPDGPPPVPDVLNMEPVVHTSTTTAVSAIATSPWAKVVAVAGQKQVVLYSSETLKPLGVLPFPEGQARVLKFSRNGTLLLAGGGRGASMGLAVVWDIRSGQRIIEVGDELDEVLAADISADQSLVALGGPGKIVRVYSTATGELAYEIVKHTDWIYSLEFSPDSVLLATADRAGGLHVWESFTGRQYLTLNGHKAAVNAVSWRIDSNVLASASEDVTIKLWEMEEGKNIKSWNGHGGGTSSVEFCRDGRIVSTGRDKVTKIWDQNGAQQRAFEAFADLALHVSHCDETDRVIAGDWTGEVRVWNAADGVRVGNLTTNPPMLTARLQQAEQQVAAVEMKLTEARAALDAATAAKNGQVQKIAAATAAHTAAQKAVVDNQAALKAEEQKLAAAQAKEKETRGTLDGLQKAIPELTSAAEKAGMASDMIPEDKELKQVVEGLKAQVAARKEELEKTQVLLTATLGEVTAYNKTIATVKQQIAEFEKQVVAQKANLDKEAAALPAFEEKLAAAQGQLNGAQANANQAIAEVERWKHYLALRDELQVLAELQEEKEKTELAALEAAAVLKEKQDQIAAMQQTVQAKQQVMADSEKKMTELTGVITAAEKQQASLTAMIATHEKVLPMLQAATAQVTAAAAMLPDDADVKVSAASLTDVTASKTEALAGFKQEVATVVDQMTKSKTMLQEVTVTFTQAQKEVAAGQEVVSKLTAESAPMIQNVTQTQTLLKAAEEKLSQANAVVEARREQLRPQPQQVTQASNG